MTSFFPLLIRPQQIMLQHEIMMEFTLSSNSYIILYTHTYAYIFNTYTCMNIYTHVCTCIDTHTYKILLRHVNRSFHLYLKYPNVLPLH